MRKIEELEATLKTVAEQLEKLKRGEISLHKRWRAKKGEEYFSISNVCGTGLLYVELSNTDDQHRYDIGNYYQTRELAQKALDKQLALVRVQDKLAEGGEVYWSDSEQPKWVIEYDYLSNGFSIVIAYTTTTATPLVTTNKKLAEKVIETMQDDLKLIFEVE